MYIINISIKDKIADENKPVVRTTVYIYVFISIIGSNHLLMKGIMRSVVSMLY